MVSVPVQCPSCQSMEVIRAGKQSNGAQRYQCQNGQCVQRVKMESAGLRCRCLLPVHPDGRVFTMCWLCLRGAHGNSKKKEEEEGKLPDA